MFLYFLYYGIEADEAANIIERQQFGVDYHS